MQRTTSEPRVNDWPTDPGLICNFPFSGGGKTLNPHISETAKDSPINIILKKVRNRLGNPLKLNADKTEILWFGSAANLQKLSADELNIRVGQSVVKPVTTVRNLGVLINAELSMRDHVL